MSVTPLKVITVGDGAQGKTSMLIAYTTKEFPNEFIPIVFDNLSINTTTTHGQLVSLALWDIAGGEDYDRLRLRLRPLSYPQTDVFLLCFGVDTDDFECIKTRWYPELHHYCPNVPVILVATKTDLRDDDRISNTITTKQGRKMAEEIRAMYYMETSSLRNEGLNELCQLVTDIGYAHAHFHKDEQIWS